MRLEQDESENALDYIITVDIFNEGVDVPAVNQVVMLRPTESPIVFIQQLGRGLRKYDGKEYVVIIDFYEYGEIDPMLFIQYSKSYDQFVKSVDKDFTVSFSDKEEAILEFISSLVNGKRIHELLMISSLLNNEKISLETYKILLEEKGEKYRESEKYL